MLFSAHSCLAGTVRIAPDAPAGSLSALELTSVVDGIGTIKIPRGRLSIKNGKAEISTIPEFQFDRVPVLDGVLIKQSITQNGSGSSIDGTIFVTEGPWLQYLWQPGQVDTIITAGGTTQGRITAIDNNLIEMDTIDKKRAAINLADVTNIQSPRTLSFHMNATPANASNLAQGFVGETGRASLTPYKPGDKVTVANLAGLKRELKKSEDGDLSNRKIAVICTAASLAQLAQTAPMITLGLQYDRFARNVYYKNLAQMTGYQMPNLGTIQSPNGFPTVNPVYPGDWSKYSAGPFYSFPTDQTNAFTILP